MSGVRKGRIETLLTMSPAERRLLVKSFFLSFYVFGVTRMSSFRSVRRLIQTSGGRNPYVSSDHCSLAERSVRRAWRISPVPGRCLEMALTLMIVLHDEGVNGELRLGVNPNLDAFASHAWVEVPECGFIASFEDWVPVATL